MIRIVNPMNFGCARTSYVFLQFGENAHMWAHEATATTAAAQVTAQCSNKKSYISPLLTLLIDFGCEFHYAFVACSESRVRVIEHQMTLQSCSSRICRHIQSRWSGISKIQISNIIFRFRRTLERTQFERKSYDRFWSPAIRNVWLNIPTVCVCVCMRP